VTFNVLQKMKYIILYILSISYSFALTENEIIDLNNKPHDDIELMEELQIFPNARRISSDITVTTTGAQNIKDKLVTTSKNIKGKYILNEFSIVEEDININFIYVITYSKKFNIYKMWTRTRIIHLDKDPVSFVIESDGLHMAESEYITWSQVPHKSKETHSIIISQLRPDGERWVSYDYKDGKIITTVKGIDKLIKE